MIDILSCPFAPRHARTNRSHAKIIEKELAQRSLDIARQLLVAQGCGEGRKLSSRRVHCRPSPMCRARIRAQAPLSIGLLTLKLCAPAVGHHIDLPPAPPATITMRSLGSLMIGTNASSLFLSTHTGKNGPFDFPRFLAIPQGRLAISNKAIWISFF